LQEAAKTPTELTAGLSVDEYLDRSFDRECELLGGETRPKPLGTGKHSKMQRRLLRLLEAAFGEGMVEFELSVRIGRGSRSGSCSA